MNVDDGNLKSNPLQRKDGRLNTQMQEIFMKKGLKKDASSSVYIETNHLKLLCSVNGPIYLTNIPKSKSDDASKMNVEVKLHVPSYYLDQHLPMNRNLIETQLEDLFSRNILVEKYARTKLIINLEIFEISCDILPYAIMGICLALNDANVEQKGIITCSNVVISNGNLLVDPTFEEEKMADFKLIFGCNMDYQENNVFLQKGNLEEAEYKKVLGTSIKICDVFHNYIISKM